MSIARASENGFSPASIGRSACMPATYSTGIWSDAFLFDESLRGSRWAAVGVEPPGPQDEQPARVCRPGERLPVRRSGSDDARYVHQEEDRHERPEPNGADPIARARRPEVDAQADDEDDPLERDRAFSRIPDTEPHLWSTGIKRHVRTMDEEVEKPM